MPPWAAAEWDRFGGTSDSTMASWPAPARADGDAQPGEAAADDQHVGIDDLHGAAPGCSQEGT